MNNLEEILYDLGLEQKQADELTLTEKRNIFQMAIDFCYACHLEDVVDLVPLTIRNNELGKGLKRAREKAPHCLGWHFTIAQLLIEPQRSKEMLYIYQNSVGYGDQAGYSALYYKLKFINEVSEPNRTDELEKLLTDLIREYCLKVDYWEAHPMWHGIFPQNDCEKIISAMAADKRLEKIEKVTNNFFVKDLLDEAVKAANFLPDLEKKDMMLKIEARRPFVKRFRLHYVARMIGC